MTTPARILRYIGITGLLAWLGMVGWVAKTTHAQNGGQVPPPVPAFAPRAEPAPAQAVPGTVSLHQPLAQAEPAPAATPTADAPPPISTIAAAGTDPAPIARAAPAPSTPAVEAVAAPIDETHDDPEGLARSFVEHNQKEAEKHLQALTAEADRLRTRLGRLESGIRRWQGLVNALRGAQAAGEEPALETVAPSAVAEPSPVVAPGLPAQTTRVAPVPR